MISASREAVLMSIVHACPYVVSLIAPFFGKQARDMPSGQLRTSPCSVFACFCFFRDDSWLLPPKWPYPWGISSSMLVVRIVQSALLNPIFRPRQTPGLLFCLHLRVYGARNVVVLAAAACANHAPSLCASYFPPRFASRKSTFFLTF
jgi:hypothetical protein